MYCGFMLIPEDVPPPWRVVPGSTPIPPPMSEHFENALGLTSTADERADVSWDMIEHESSGLRVILRMVPDFGAAPTGRSNIIGAIVTALVALPELGSVELRAATLRDVPTKNIQTRTGIRLGQTNHVLSEFLSSPDPKFAHAGAVARRWLELQAAGVRNPAHTIAAERGRALSTVQAWVADARALGALPRNAQGTSGRPGTEEQ